MLRTIHQTGTITRWDWEDADTGRARARAELDDLGVTWFRWPGSAAAVGRDPAAFTYSILGERPGRVDANAVRYDGESAATQAYFPNTRIAIPLHTDGHFTEWPTPYLVMVCAHGARSGGASVLQDGWHLLANIAEDEPSLFARLFDEQRHMQLLGGKRFYDAPTVSPRHGSVMLIHPAYNPPEDPTGQEFQAWVETSDTVRIAPQADDVFVLNNWRMLHARDEFEDPEREFVRLWPHDLTPCPAPEFLRTRVRR